MIPLHYAMHNVISSCLRPYCKIEIDIRHSDLLSREVVMHTNELLKIISHFFVLKQHKRGILLQIHAVLSLSKQTAKYYYNYDLF